ncbi:MAG: hypothetical protein ABIZ81_08170 [Opitutaceae bacterium]
MKRRLFFALLSMVALLSGCSFLKKNPKPKANPAIAADTDENFRQRFVERRTGELVTGGVAPETARAQATEEFKARYGYTSAAKK